MDKILNLRTALQTPAEKAPSQASSPSAAETEPVSASPAESQPDREKLLAELREAEAELRGLQGESPLIFPHVDAQAVASVIADWTGIPVGRMVKNEIQAVLSLADNLEKRVVGQRHALEAIARRIQTSRAALDNPSKPIGVFMLAGPSGVGKTETALALAETLYGGEGNLITINMSEFQEAHRFHAQRFATRLRRLRRRRRPHRRVRRRRIPWCFSTKSKRRIPTHEIFQASTRASWKTAKAV